MKTIGEHKKLKFGEALGVAREVLEREAPTSPSSSGLLGPREYSALEKLVAFAASCRRSMPASTRRKYA